MKYSVTNIDTDRAKPLITASDTPSVIYASSASLTIDDSKTHVLWTAAVEIDNKFDKDEIKVGLTSVKETLDEALICDQIKAHPLFDKVSSELNTFIQDHQSQIDDYKNSQSFDVMKGSQKLCCNPNPSKHEPGNVYIKLDYQSPVGKLKSFGTWSFSMTKGQFKLISYKSYDSDIMYDSGNRWLGAIQKHLMKPELSMLNQVIANCSMIINDIDFNIAKRKNINSKVRIEYRNSGQTAALKNHVNINDNELVIVWDGDFAPRVGWQISFRGFEYRNGDVYDHLGVTTMETEGFELPHDVLVFSNTECIDELELNNSMSQSDIVEKIIGSLKAQESVTHDFRMFYTEFKGLRRISRIQHTFHLQNNFLNIIWEIAGDVSDGFSMWPKANFKLLHIKISGIKYTYFPDSELFAPLMKLFPDDFLSNSIMQSRLYLVTNHEPFYRMVAGT